jgi:hypothetical protein
LAQLRNDLLRLVPLRHLIRPPQLKEPRYKADHFSGGGSNDRALAFYRRQGFAEVGEASFTLDGQACENRVLTIGLPR